MQARYIYVADKEKQSKFMSSKDTHLISSDLAFHSLVFDETHFVLFLWLLARNHNINRVTYVCNV